MQTLSFVHAPHPARIVFGAGRRAELAAETERLGLRRVLLIASPSHADEAARSLGSSVVAATTDIVMHVPRERADDAIALARKAEADGVVAIGGGSAVGLAKALALETALPVVAIPTTYAGSEMTSVWGLTERGAKRTGRNEVVRPKTVIYDPELTRTLPPALAGTSALNAIAHAMEALYAPDVPPLLEAMAEESVRALVRAVPRRADGRDAEAEALYGAWLAGVCLDRGTMGLHHKLCHVLGGTFGLPHAEVHSVVVAHVAAFNAPVARSAMDRLARALGSTDVPAALSAFGEAVGAPRSLAELGLAEPDLARVADAVTSAPYENPRVVRHADVVTLLGDALAGRPPRTWARDEIEVARPLRAKEAS